MGKTTPLGQIPIQLIKVKNRYRLDRGDIQSMADSLKELGQIQPIVLGKGMKLLAGERRLEGAKLLGWETIRAEAREGDTTTEELEIELAENQIRKDFTWPEVARLEKTIWDLKVAKDPKWTQRDQAAYRDTALGGVNMRLKLAEALDLLPELAECSTQDDAWKQYKKLEETILVGKMRNETPDHIKNAPVWAIDHYIVGDALEWMALCQSEITDFAEIDPPYGIDLLRRKGRNISEGHTEDYNEIDEGAFPAFMTSVIREVHRILKPNTFAVFWYGMQWHCEMLVWLRAAGFAVNPMPGLWYKGQAGQTAQPDVALASCYEPFFLARKGTPKMLRQGRSNVFHYSPLAPSRKIHPTERPVELLADILETMLFPGATILVPFLGSGATLRAAYKTGHSGFGYDLSEGNKDRFLKAVQKEFSNEDIEDIEEDEDEQSDINES